MRLRPAVQGEPLQLVRVDKEEIWGFCQDFYNLPREFFGQNLTKDVTFDDFLAFLAGKLKVPVPALKQLDPEQLTKVQRVWASYHDVVLRRLKKKK
jgi:hypothetical protein